MKRDLNMLITCGVGLGDSREGEGEVEDPAARGHKGRARALRD